MPLVAVVEREGHFLSGVNDKNCEIRRSSRLVSAIKSSYQICMLRDAASFDSSEEIALLNSY